VRGSIPRAIEAATRSPQAIPGGCAGRSPTMAAPPWRSSISRRAR